MNYKRLVWLMAGSILLSWSVHLTAEEHIPPSPPAKMAGYVYLHGHLLEGIGGYTIMASVGSKRFGSDVDSKGRYTIIIPQDGAVNSGEMLKVVLFHEGRRVSTTRRLEVPVFGQMRVVNLEF